MRTIPREYRGTTAEKYISSLSSEFVYRSKDILEVTRERHYLSRNKGLYAHYLVKFIKRIRNSLGIGREILLLFSNFEDLQPRIVEAAESLLKTDSGRVESGVCVIVHQDQNGDSKLRQWGREKGILIVPLFLPELDISSAVIEKMISAEFYANDPFDVSGPVSDDNSFFGRKNESLEAARQLRKGQIKSYLGIRKVGKTSLLHRIVDDVKKHDDSCIVMIDCSRDSIAGMNAIGLVGAISDTIKTMGEKKYASINATKRTASNGIDVASEELLTVIKESPKTVILMFDEVDYITPSSPLNIKWREEFNIFWRNIRAVHQDCRRQGLIFSIVVSGVSGNWFRTESIEGIENAALAFIPENYLESLSTEAAKTMMRELSLRCGIHLPVGGPEIIASACSHIPFWMRKFGSYMHKSLSYDNRPLDPTIEDIEALIENYIEEEGFAMSSVALNHLFKIDGSIEDACKTIKEGKEIKKSEHIKLVKYGIVKPIGKNLEFSGKLMKFTIENMLEEKVLVDPQDTKEDISQDEQWAEDLAVLTRKMSLLEAKMRSIALNFLRMDSLLNRGDSADERIFKCISDTRRGALKRLSGEALIGKLFWLELKNIYIKEWKLFEVIFSDKKRFQDATDILNDRPYAHAKQVDLIYLAMYNREVDWMREKIDKI